MLIAFDLLLVVVLGLLLYSVSARDPQPPPGLFDVLQVVLVVSALVADAVALSAIAARISEFGFTPNRVAALGENVILLVNLAWSARALRPLPATGAGRSRTSSGGRRTTCRSMRRGRRRWWSCFRRSSDSGDLPSPSTPAFISRVIGLRGRALGVSFPRDRGSGVAVPYIPPRRPRHSCRISGALPMRCVPAVLFLAATMAGCQPKTPDAAVKSPDPVATTVAEDAITGQVQEQLSAPPYTYLRIKTSSGDVWAAVPETKVEVGTTVTVMNPLEMTNFESKTLQRTFAEIWFGALPGADTPAGAMPPSASHTTAPTVAVKVAKATGSERPHRGRDLGPDGEAGGQERHGTRRGCEIHSRGDGEELDPPAGRQWRPREGDQRHHGDLARYRCQG